MANLAANCGRRLKVGDTSRYGFEWARGRSCNSSWGMIHDHLHVSGMSFCLFSITSTIKNKYFAIKPFHRGKFAYTCSLLKTIVISPLFNPSYLLSNIVNNWTIVLILNGYYTPGQSGMIFNEILIIRYLLAPFHIPHFLFLSESLVCDRGIFVVA